ncbi:2-oxo acid dehydrogenase subunit E2 [Anatilimnocola floriformis]|uniref:2-oxo acid dehydrogenase subunit E2 n=1 Tax=Anatilimnocola floriformis TaxID=2948575 RepID=UPI0020C2C5F1|nr:2-oxo acid dehydrogenase subunit E2 [Anatilimnocola floriformis]
MAIEVKLPNLGEGVESGDIVDILVSEGDTIAKDQAIIDIETGKATMQVPSDFAGKVVKVHIKKGQTVKNGAVLLTLEGAAAGASAAPAKPAPAAEAPKAAPAPAKPAPQPAAPAPQPAAAKPAPVAPAPVKAVPAPQPVAQAPVATIAPAEEAAEYGDVAAGPAVRRFAREVGVDLSRVTGSGPGGRISREDVLAVVRAQSQGVGVNSSKTDAGSSARDNYGPIHVEKMTKIRKVIAAQMHKSWTTCPRVTNFDDADVTELEKIRVSSKDDYARKGIKLTSLPFVVKAVAMALKSHPTINASIDEDGEHIIFKDYVNVGIAVDTDRGLMVPSLRHPDTMSIPDVARALGTISENVRDGKITAADMQGSTFTISNLGAIGGTYSTPIINVPEVAILLVGRARKMPVVVNDEIVIRLMMPLSISYDHRLVDGGAAARFLNDVIDYLKSPSRLLLAP